MISEGPDIRELTRHLADTPAIFLEEPMQPSGQGGVHVHAVVSDLLVALGGEPLAEAQMPQFRYFDRHAVRSERNRLRLALLGAWLFSHPSLRQAQAPDRVRRWLGEETAQLAALVAVEDLVGDSDRREEFARLGLQVLDLRPLGESEGEARSRLAALSSVERHRVIAEARQAEERARQVREEMERRRQAEAASVYSNE